jgi:hypothetical protein
MPSQVHQRTYVALPPAQPRQCFRMAWPGVVSFIDLGLGSRPEASSAGVGEIVGHASRTG